MKQGAGFGLEVWSDLLEAESALKGTDSAEEQTGRRAGKASSPNENRWLPHSPVREVRGLDRGSSMYDCGVLYAMGWAQGLGEN